MGNLKSDTIGGFNAFLSGQKEAEGSATFSLVQFSDDYRDTVTRSDIHQVVELNGETYQPTGPSTRLRDAIGRSINETRSWLDGMSDAVAPGKVIFVILTDGEENDSREFTKKQIAEMIKEQEAKDWNFVFLGANQDAIMTGMEYGMKAGNTLTMAASKKGTRVAYENLSKDMCAYRGGMSASVQNFVSTSSKTDQDAELKKQGSQWTNNTDDATNDS
tara:strand:+ start:574 stop:1227 length:654 start_codon:yes stop_codon:yes gene_type:complete